MSQIHVALGLDQLRNEHWRSLKNYRIGLLSNQASLDRDLLAAKEVIHQCLPGHLKALFGPQHGYGGLEQDNMIETCHTEDPDLHIPVFSLYTEMREPTSEMLNLIDILIIDLQDVGTRVYTFISTVLNCLKAAARYGIPIMILDRPNPLGGEIIEGNLLKPELYSFVGPYRLPMRHGMTLAELARLFIKVYDLDVDLRLILMKGWRRNMFWHHTGLRWVMPSPNMPLPETAYVYPGQVCWEGTNLSEGRGTCRPFEIFGAPFLKTKEIKACLDPEALKGCLLQEITFQPTFNKWADQACRGFMIHIIDHATFRPFSLAVHLLKTLIDTGHHDFHWREPPYEYEYEKLPIDLIMGDSKLRENLERKTGLVELKKQWQHEIDDFYSRREPFLLYQ